MADAKKDSKVFDVAKPGKAAADATSKPIIVTNRPLMADPMVVEDSAEEKTESEPKLTAPSAGKLKIEPLKHDDLATTGDEKVDGADAATKTDEKTQSISTETIDSIPEEAEVTGRNQLKDAGTDAEDLAARKAAEREAQLEKIAEAKTYYLPINQVEHRRNKRAAVLGLALVIVLGAAWADVALDAGLISLPGVKAPTHFFSN